MQDREALHRLNLKVNYEFERLFKEAGLAPLLLHQLVKTFQTETSKFTFDEIEDRLHSIYALPYDQRTGGVVTKTFGIRPYPWLSGQLLLNFRTLSSAGSVFVLNVSAMSTAKRSANQKLC